MYYSVFNVEQVENLPEGVMPGVEEDQANCSPIEEAERLVAEMPNRPEVRDGAPRASYSPVLDSVSMPHRNLFRSPEDYYSTLYHELTHSTGHGTRLARKGVVEASNFGSDPYSREELVAEMGAAFLCGHCGIEQRTLDNSAAYIQHWLSRLRDDRRLVVSAAAQAQKACDFILRRESYSNDGRTDVLD